MHLYDPRRKPSPEIGWHCNKNQIVEINEKNTREKKFARVLSENGIKWNNYKILQGKNVRPTDFDLLNLNSGNWVFNRKNENHIKSFQQNDFSLMYELTSDEIVFGGCRKING